MREALRDAGYPRHAGLAYDLWAPLAKDGKLDEKEREVWLHHIEALDAPDGYAIAFRRWCASLEGRARMISVRARSRLLIGHGNPAATEVGLTLHRTWGVPLIPGSALKGLAANYVQTVYGPDRNDGPHPRDPGHPEPDRAPFQGVSWQNRHIVQGPGEVYRRIFGAPEVDGNSAHELGASQGEVVFHDALWEPEDGKPMLARDILTVHQRSYYQDQAHQSWPNDHDEPTPIAFLTVRPGARFLIALSGPPEPELMERVERYLLEALEQWGIGGKTSAGYGRLVRDKQRPRGAAPVLDELEAWLTTQKAAEVLQRDQLAMLEPEWIERLQALPPAEQHEAARSLRKRLSSPKLEKQLNELLSRLSRRS